MKHRMAIVSALVVLLSTIAWGLLGRHAGSIAAASGSIWPDEFVANFTEALDTIQQNYVAPVDSDKLVYGAIKGMLRGLDPHSNFLDPEDFVKLREEQHSRFCGLGIQVRPLSPDEGQHVIVEQPGVGTPARQKGLRLGDVITHIGGESIGGWRTDDVVNHLKGPCGTQVGITIDRPGVREPLQFTIQRDEIPLNTVPYAFELKSGIGYLKIERFSETTAKELRTKLDNLKGLTGLILDLRDNPGGLLNQAIEVADFFLHRGDLIVSTKGRMDGSAKSYKAPGEGKIQLPVVILINHQSASASEILAGALQDHDRALIVGETSFGKGLVQTVYALDSDAGLTLTTAKYYTPSGRLIQRDYSNSSFFEYYNANPVQNKGSREVRYTDGKRPVYGGGGITPDIIESPRKLNRFELMLSVRDVFFQYGRQIALNEASGPNNFQFENGEAPFPPGELSKSLAALEINGEVLSDFKEFLRGRHIDFSEEDFSTNLDFVKRRIRQDALISLLGIRESFRAAIQTDPQVLKALEVMPEAKTLMTTGRPIPSNQTHN